MVRSLLTLLLFAGFGACDCDTRLTPAELEALAHKAAAKASALRGLALPSAAERFEQEITSKEAVRGYLSARLEAVDAKKDFRTTTDVLSDFGAVAPGVDLQQRYLEVATDQVAGFYDWEKRTLYVADWVPSMAQGPVMVHEITHALQDHHFGLARFMEPMRGYGDAQHAVQALIEGDATLVMVDAFIGQAASDELYRAMTDDLARQVHLDDVPDIINEMIGFPYIAGLRVALKARSQAGGWHGVDRLYRDLPLSTEQIIHPDKLVGATLDYPQDVHLEAPAPLTERGWDVVDSDVLGELLLRFVIRKGALDADAAAAAAAGWDGDRVMLLRQATSGATATLLASVWDSVEDAQEAFDGLADTARPPAALVRKDRRLVGIWGEPGPAAEGAAHHVLNNFTTTEVRSWRYFEEASSDKANK